MTRRPGVWIALLILVGLGVMAYPTASHLVNRRSQTRVIQAYQVSAQALSAERREELLAEARAYNDALAGEWDYLSLLSLDGVMGYISIPAIDVYLPIYHTVDEDVLKKGVGHMEGTALPVGGAGTHAVLTAHRGLPSARLFTDLVDLDRGDMFYLHVLDEVLAYQVDLITVAEPHEMEALAPVEGEDYVTLVTCTPYGVNSHRYFVRGTRVFLAPEEVGEVPLPEGRGGVWVLLAGAAAVAVLILVLRRLRRR